MRKIKNIWEIMESDKFQELNHEAQLLYLVIFVHNLYLGAVENPKTLMKQYNCSDFSLKVLADKGLITLKDNKIQVILK